MPARQEPMERLAATDPLPDAERLTPEERREADALLARLLATPPASPAGRSHVRPRLRRRALGVAAAAGAALVAFAAVNVLESDTPGPNVVELAVAAVSHDDAIYHVLDSRRARSFGPGSRPGDNRTVYFESWHTTDGRQHQKFFAARGDHRGRLVGEYAGRRRPGRRGGPMLTWDARTNTITSIRFGSSRGSRGAPGLDQFAGPAAQLRALEAEGRLRSAGTVEVGGRRAYRLVSDTERLSGGVRERSEFVVDAETYLPLSSRYRAAGPENGYELITRYLVYERLPLDSRGKAKLDLDPHPGANCAPHAGEIMGRGTLGFPNPCAR
jgi:hypothetical protein